MDTLGGTNRFGHPSLTQEALRGTGSALHTTSMLPVMAGRRRPFNLVPLMGTSKGYSSFNIRTHYVCCIRKSRPRGGLDESVWKSPVESSGRTRRVVG